MREIKPPLQSTKDLTPERARKVREHYIPELNIEATVRQALGITGAYRELMRSIAKKARVHYAWMGRTSLHTSPVWDKCIELATMDVVYAQHLSRFTRPSMRVLDDQLDVIGPRKLAPIIAQEMQLAVQLEPRYERAYTVIVTDTIGQTFNVMPIVFPTIGLARSEARRLRLDEINGRDAVFQVVDLKSIWEEDGYAN